GMFHAPERVTLAFASILALVTAAADAGAQPVPPPVQGGYSTGPQTWQTGPMQPAPYPMRPAPYTGPQAPTSQDATDLELGTLYAMSAGYGVGAGVWLDAELSLDDPGLK